MKKLIALILVTMTVSAQAQHHHHRGSNWVAPMVIGGVVGYALTRNYYEPVYNYGYVPPPTVVVQPPARAVCTPWTETQHPDGSITRTRTCSQ